MNEELSVKQQMENYGEYIKTLKIQEGEELFPEFKGTGEDAIKLTIGWANSKKWQLTDLDIIKMGEFMGRAAKGLGPEFAEMAMEAICAYLHSGKE